MGRARMPRVWVRVFAEDVSRDAVVTGMTAAGVAVEEGERAAGAGVIVFDELRDDVLAAFRAAGARGARPVVAISTAPRLEADQCWRLLAAGAADAFCWDECAAGRIAARIERSQRVDELLHSPTVREAVVGESHAWLSVLRDIVEVAYFTDAPVLVTGETGTGKELIARLVHALDPRPRKRDLVLLDCTSITPTLSGSEFFGHERGAFTGAAEARDGAVALADGGTLFLDEVGELPLTLQAELLRVVQEGTYKRVGSNTWRRTSFRLVCATNRDLQREAEAQQFRWDFYYRIAAWTCRLPALRERPDDILPLARHFLGSAADADEPAPDVEPVVADYLVSRRYPGNVRDLRHLIARMRARHVGAGPLTVGDLPEDERPENAEPTDAADTVDAFVRKALARGATLREIGTAATEAAINAAVAEEHGNLQRAAARLGVTPRALQLRRAAAQRGEGYADAS